MTQLHIAVREGRKAVIPTTLPVVFSAGPIRNGPIWQNEAMRIAVNRGEDIFFVSPVRDTTDFDMKLSSYLAPFSTDDNFPRQRAMEQNYIDIACLRAKAPKGCLFIWFAKPLPKEQWTHPDKSYAFMSAVEFGEALIYKKIFPDTRVVVGFEPGFPEQGTLEYEIETKAPSIPVFYTLEETVNAAIDIAIGG